MARNAGNYRVNDSAANASRTIADTTHRWHMYRVPLNDTAQGIFQQVGSPAWNQIKYIRVWWSNFKGLNRTTRNVVQFARWQFVGNQWLETPIVNADSSSETKLQVSTVNTDDNLGYYAPPPGVYRQPDDKGNPARESSLDLTYKNITPGTIALVRRSLAFQPLNLSDYNDISLRSTATPRAPGSGSSSGSAPTTPPTTRCARRLSGWGRGWLEDP